MILQKKLLSFSNSYSNTDEVANQNFWGNLFFLTALLTIAFFYTYANLNAPVQRDGAHFIFMANNIANGQPPYWASFETKNPLVELYWSPFILFLSPTFGIIGSARIAEGFWIVATAMLIFVVVRAMNQGANPSPVIFEKYILSAIPAAAISIFYLILIMDVRTSDYGLNVSMYQSLPELALIAYSLNPPNKLRFINGLLFGTLIFLAWFIKQTAALPAVAILITQSIIYRNQLMYKYWVGVVIGIATLLGIFALHLSITDTWNNYLLGTYTYKTSLIPLAGSEFISNAINAYKVPALAARDLSSFLAAHQVWTGIATVILSAWSIQKLTSTRIQGWVLQRKALALTTVWLITAWMQAIAGLTFFSHYFLASIAPVLLTLGVLLSFVFKKITITISIVLIISSTTLISGYTFMKAANNLRHDTAPINISVTEVMQHLKPQDRIFNWSGLPHILIEHGAPSAYPINMYWPYIMTALSEETRSKMLQETLKRAPDVVIAITEQYPLNQALQAEDMTTERLHELTKQTYKLEYETPRREGRYGNPIKVFRRQ